MNSNQQKSNKRVGKNHAQPQGLARTDAKNAVIEQLLAGELSQGQALKILRIEVLAMKQTEFANLVNISRKSLSDIENDKGNYTVAMLNQVFRPFGLQMALQPIQK